MPVTESAHHALVDDRNTYDRQDQDRKVRKPSPGDQPGQVFSEAVLKHGLYHPVPASHVLRDIVKIRKEIAEDGRKRRAFDPERCKADKQVVEDKVQQVRRDMHLRGKPRIVVDVHEVRHHDRKGEYGHADGVNGRHVAHHARKLSGCPRRPDERGHQYGKKTREDQRVQDTEENAEAHDSPGILRVPPAEEDRHRDGAA